MKVGVLGSGQLGMMLAEAGRRIDIDCICYGPDPNPCAASACEVIIGDFLDDQRIRQLVDQVDVIAVESEHIPLSLLQRLEQERPLHPSARAVGIAQDRLLEKQFLQSLQIPLAPFTQVDDAQDLRSLLHQRPGSYIVKTRLQGYDGKGQAGIDQITRVEEVLAQLGGHKLVAEQRIQFDREVSIISVRARDGVIHHYPITENEHRAGILRTTRMIDAPDLQQQAEAIAQRMLADLGYVGVLCVEFFDLQGQLLVNEFAPRVHNSGHITIEAAATSQFENHLRAITGMPLGDCEKRMECVMLNVIGEEPDLSSMQIDSNYHYHPYNKQPRPGRKLGHITVCDEDSERLTRSVEGIEKALGRH